MKIDYLSDLTNGGKYKQVVAKQIVRIWDFDWQEARKLRHVLTDKMAGINGILDMSTVPFIDQSNCHLVFEIADDEYGLITSDGFKFVCKLTRERYEKIADMIEPFCEPDDRAGHQWFCDVREGDTESDIALLFSPGGTW